MGHLSWSELQSLLDQASSNVVVGRRYMHHKGKSYRVTGLCILESTDTVGVLYQPETSGLEGITFLRPLEDFVAEVEENGVQKKRFEKM